MSGASFAERGYHDVGGQPAGPVGHDEHDYEAWERRVDAMMVLVTGVKPNLLGRRLLTVDELRKNIEALPPAAYDGLGYYERWILSLAQGLLQRGLITTEDLARKMEEVKRRG